MTNPRGDLTLRERIEALRPRALEYTTERAGFEDGLNAVLELIGCGDPEHPQGAYCTGTTGLHTCYPPERLDKR